MIAELALRLPSGSQAGDRLPARGAAAGRPPSRRRAASSRSGATISPWTPRRPVRCSAERVSTRRRGVQDLVERTEGWPAGSVPRGPGHECRQPESECCEFTFTGDDRFMARLPPLGVPRPRLAPAMCRSSPGPRSSSGCPGRLWTSPWAPGVRPAARPARAQQPAADPARPATASGTATTTCSASCCTPSWCGGSRRCCPSSTPAPLRGTSERPAGSGIAHAQQAGDADRVARLVLRGANPVWASGRLDTVLRWMEWFSANGPIEQHPAVAVHGALIYALVGKPATPNGGPRPRSARRSRARCRTATRWRARSPTCARLLCRAGLDEMRRDAQLALDGLSPTSPYRPAMLHAEGAADLLQGNPIEADVFFVRSRRRGVEQPASSPSSRSCSPSAASSPSSATRGRTPTALARRCPGAHGATASSTTTGPARSCSRGRACRVQRGDVPQARDLVRRGRPASGPLLTYALPDRVGAGAPGAGPRLHRPGRPRRRACGPQPDRRHPSAPA